ncbi:hypothetical protein BDV39DRAFT_209089 [Aspergillus sergii]|uniref:Uncharacterized protein n=1 Tax=Aspergillus sergii TaxID=1034303 RepID=A0A5N6WQT0_9EURO|nr:hypothetical protein BDV39DRAFT_209089 [Aspergillus sergii]
MRLLQFGFIGYAAATMLGDSTCSKAYQLTMRNSDAFLNELQTRICDKGCSFTVQDYEDGIKEQIHRPYVERMMRDHLGRSDSYTTDADVLVEMGASMLSTAAEKCKSETRDADLATRDDPPFDICAHLSKECVKQIKSQLPGLMLKKAPFFLGLAGTTSCSDVVKFQESPETKTIVAQGMDQYAENCPRRT